MLKHLLGCWPTYWWAGIKVREISADWTLARVELKLGLLNRNFFGTAFGGSLYAMTDPFYALLMFGQLGDGYVVWDKAAQVQFIKPGRGRMTAEFVLPVAEVARVRALADASDNAKVEPEYSVEVRDQRGELVARVHKTLYVRRAAPAALR
jgi:acyl-coenzyme A thioesterase PaaI-like protein